MDGVPQHAVVGCRCTGAPPPSATSTAGVDVVVVAVRAEDGDEPPAADRGEDRRRVVGRVDDDHLVVVADQPDVVLDVEVLPSSENVPAVTIPSMRAVTARRPERSTSPWCIFSKACSTSAEADRLADEAVERQPAGEVELDQGREVARGQAVAVPRGPSADPPRPNTVDERHVDAHRGVRDADEHDGCRRGRGRRTPAATSRACRRRRRRRPAPKPPVSSWIAATASALRAFTVCVAPKSRAHSSFRSSTSTAMIRRAPTSRGTGDRRVADAAAADDGDGVVARDVAGVDRRRRCRP
jgi:hypothetical protein